jgi:hypothetical protein
MFFLSLRSDGTGVVDVVVGVVVVVVVAVVVVGVDVVVGGAEVAAWAGTMTALMIGFIHLLGSTSVVATPPISIAFSTLRRSGRSL